MWIILLGHVQFTHLPSRLDDLHLTERSTKDTSKSSLGSLWSGLKGAARYFSINGMAACSSALKEKEKLGYKEHLVFNGSIYKQLLKK